MNSHLVNVKMRISFVFGQSSDVAVPRITTKSEKKKKKKQIPIRQSHNDLRYKITYLLEYVSSKESFSSTMGIELTRAAKDRLKQQHKPDAIEDDGYSKETRWNLIIL